MMDAPLARMDVVCNLSLHPSIWCLNVCHLNLFSQIVFLFYILYFIIGFQNCPKFCENTDKATCFGDFEVPIVDTSGYYTFVWYWIFNPGSPYITCWEAYIEADGSATEPSAPSSVEYT